MAEPPDDQLILEFQVLTVSEAAQVLRIGRRQAYEAVRRGEIPSTRIGRSIRIPVSALRRQLFDGPGLYRKRVEEVLAGNLIQRDDSPEGISPLDHPS